MFLGTCLSTLALCSCCLCSHRLHGLFEQVSMNRCVSLLGCWDFFPLSTPPWLLSKPTDVELVQGRLVGNDEASLFIFVSHAQLFFSHARRPHTHWALVDQPLAHRRRLFSCFAFVHELCHEFHRRLDP
jgi:hypothetical protein